MRYPECEENLAAYCRSWKRHGIFFGIESGRSQIKRLGRIFPAACCSLDAGWRAEEHLPALSLNVVSECLHYRFPHSYTDRAKRGRLNPNFLNSRLLLREHIFAVLNNQLVTPRHVLFPIPKISRTEGVSSYDLLARLEAFLDSLPGSYDYAVQLSNPELLIPALFDTLSARNVALVMTDSNGMPSLLDQILSPFLFTADSLLVVSEMQDATLWRLGIVETVRRCVTEKKQLYCYFRDQEEARLHHGLLELMQMMNGDLAKLSPIKQRAA